MTTYIASPIAASNRNVALLFLVLAVIITTTTHLLPRTMAQPLSAYESPPRYVCPKMPASCSCSFVISDLEIQCPIADPNIIVRIQPGTYVQIECVKMNERDYSLLPPMDIGDTPMVQIRRCPLPRGQSLDAILKRIGTRRVRSLLFQGYGTDLGSTLVREHLRGFHDLERLVLSGNGLSDLPADLFSDLRNLTWLDLKWNRVHLPQDIFTNLEKLEFLELGYNNLQQLEAGVFREQKRLKHLNLWGNNLQNLTRNSFVGISSIIDLDLSTNKLTSLEEDVFEPLTNLRNINLSGNNFTELPEGLFVNNKKLTQIRLLDNRRRMETLPSGFLSDLPELEDVRIKTYLTEVPENLFSGSEKIRNISLANNELITLPSELFANQSSLIDLDLSRNKLADLPDDIFVSTRSLLVLNLAHNKLVNITRDLFSSLRHLQTLELQNNDLHTIHLQAFALTQHLRIINLQNNRLTFKDAIDGYSEGMTYEIGSPLQYITDLQSLNLRNNSISYIFRDWTYNLPNLAMLDLSHNNITMLSAANLQFLSQRLEVNISNNAIEEIDFDPILYMEPSAEQQISVEIGKNPIVCNCVLLNFVQFIHGRIAANMAKNIRIFPGELKCSGPEKLSGRLVTQLNPRELLCPLDSASSKMKRCPDECSCWVRLVDRALIVNCSDSGLIEVPPLPKNVSEFGLRSIELHVENNNLTALPERDHPGFAYISEIHARHNNISQFSANNIPTNLSLLDISNNSLGWINSTVFDAINATNRLESLSLGNNPWQCDCGAVSLLKFVLTNSRRIQDLNTIKCPGGSVLSSMAEGDICPEDQILVIVACVIAVLGILFGILATLYYRYQSEIKVWLYAHNMCLWFVTEDELDKDKKYDAFISYSHKDEDFVTEHLLPNLENGTVPYKLCLHERDWIVGEYIPNQIVRSVEDSRRTIVVLSPNFLESIWGRMEFQAAHKAALQEGRARVIVIIYGDIGNMENLDPELKAYLNVNTYVKWDDPWFWKKLRYAMPHPQLRTPAVTKGLVKSVIKSSTDDKLELIKPVPVTPPPLTTPPAEQAQKNLLTPKMNGCIGNGTGNMAIVGTNGLNGHVNGAFIINTSAKQSDV